MTCEFETIANDSSKQTRLLAHDRMGPRFWERQRHSTDSIDDHGNGGPASGLATKSAGAEKRVLQMIARRASQCPSLDDVRASRSTLHDAVTHLPPQRPGKGDRLPLADRVQQVGGSALRGWGCIATLFKYL